MDDELLNLANRKPSSKAAQLRAALPEINAALDAGASHLEILAALNKRGFNLKFTVYQTMLFRIKKQPKKEKHNAAKATDTAEKTPAKPEQKPISGKQPFKFKNTAENKWE
ncbi:hypothetical protein [Iodobacter sp.]|uniref:hypothetical protein n=1 Tax=Iodobacter sp. TaxID=1915058 RepID=UPI0025D1C04E|nr:hypothetical protein [Iodobacter sp.]